MKRAMILVAGAALAACAGKPPVEVRIQRVEVPVAVQPIAPAQVPAMPKPLPKRPASVSAALDLALAKVCEFVGYALRADPLLRVSAGMAQAEPAKYPECEGR